MSQGNHPAMRILRRLSQDPWAWASGLWLLLMLGVALAGGRLGTDSSPDADRQWLSKRLLPPGSLVEATQHISHDRFSTPSYAWEPKQNKDHIESYGLSRSFRFVLGTDALGRDFLSRLALGARISLGIGWMSVLVALCTGLLVGSLAGWFGGWTDRVLNFLTNLTWSIPTLLMVMSITLVLGKGLFPVFLAVGLSTWVEIARITRAEIRSLAQLDYVMAGRSLGFSNARLLLKHMLPALTGPLLVASTANFAGAILIESGLSFLGLGVQPPTPTWGSMIEAHRHYLLSGNAHLVWLPGLAIVTAVLAFNLLGNSLKTALKEA